jgi:hypothetical protein
LVCYAATQKRRLARVAVLEEAMRERVAAEAAAKLQAAHVVRSRCVHMRCRAL